MKWTNLFSAESDPDTVFETLVDIPTIAPCMPGASLTGTTDDGGYEGTVKVKLGPITAQYKGKAYLIDTDRATRRAVLRAEGAETRGQGTASATITAVCAPDGAGTRVEIETDLKITGKVAQFGRGVLQDVSAKLIGQFADCLSSSVLRTAGGAPQLPEPPTEEIPLPATGDVAPPAAVEVAPVSEPPPAADAAPSGSSPRGPAPKPVSDVVDLREVAGPAVAKRAIPVIAALVILIIIWRLVRSRGD